MKEIHFYTNLNNIEQVSDWDLETMDTDYVSSVKSINDKNRDVVKTTQLCLLTDAWDFIDMKYKVYIHNGENAFEVKENMRGTDKEIRRGMNIQKLLLGGTFGEIE